ncbi:MAG: hypothetical protein KGH56_01570 [Patescibacteria group bacterium]|nr:hypothetical protein [Patescibacteria group bacterium]
MSSAPRELFIVYESAHAEEAHGRADAGATVICLHFLLERELASRGIPFVPLPEIVDLAEEEGEWLMRSHEISREWYRIPAMSFFAYKGIRIAEAPEPVMQAYLARLFYYALICLGIKKKYPDARVIIPEPPAFAGSAAAVCLAPFVQRAIVDAARMVWLDFAPRGPRAVPEYAPPRITRKWLALRLFNALVGLLPRRGLRVYASEYWTHLAPVEPRLRDTELMLLESRQVFRIPWRALLARRIRVFLSHDVISAREERAAKEVCAEFAERWEAAKKDVAAYLNSVDDRVDWSPVVEACEYLIAYAPRVIADIRTLERTMRREKPDLVLQMASVGGPEHYFFLMAKIARLLGIPSLELEHATATIDPRSVFCRIETDYLATYGEDVNRWHERIGHARERLIAVGSPRFDRYVNDRAAGVAEGKRLFGTLGLDPSRPIFFVSVPFSERYVGTPDSYQLAEFFETVRSVQEKVSGLQILFKFRSRAHVGAMRSHLQELFPAGIAFAADEDIFALLCASDVALCNNSTVIYQAVLARKPLVLYPWKRFDSYHAQVYSAEIPLFYDAPEAIESVVRAFTDPAYRDALLERQERFLGRYSFDGHSSERVAALLHSIVRKKRI